MGFGMAPTQCGIHSKPQSLLQKTCIFHTFETLATYAGLCLRMPALAHIWAEGHLGLLFPKIDFCSFKSYIFHFNTPQINLISD